MEIPLNAQVECIDGVCGRSEYVLINPVINQVTHLVVKKEAIPHTEYLVPVELITETIVDTIRLQCSRSELEKMNPLIKTTFIQEKVPDWDLSLGGGTYGMGTYYYFPYNTPEKTIYVPVEQEQIPPGELAVHRGTHVEATDGYVGKVDEFVVNPENRRITHLVMREGHLWGKKDVIVPLSVMGDMRADTLFLNINKHQIESLPTFPVNRLWA